MSTHQSQSCGDSSCGHSHETAGTAEQEKDFNEILEESHPCCQKDAASKARGLKLRAALDKVDPSQVAERARKAAFSLAGALSDSQLPVCGGGGDYPALQEARRAAAAAACGARGPRGSVGASDGVDGRYRGGSGAGGGLDDSEDDDDDDDMDYLLDDPEIVRMEQARVEAMHADATKLETLRALGFGLHVEVAESEVEATANGQFRGAGVVVHLYSADSKLSASLDLLLEAKAASYMGTRFVRCRLRPESAVASRMRVKRVPALACYKGGVRVAYTEEMAQFGDSQGADAGAVDRWLVASGTLEFDPPNPNALRTGGVGAVAGGGLGDDDEAEGGQEDAVARYDCGLESCRKSFKHSHFSAAGDAGLPQGFHERL